MAQTEEPNGFRAASDSERAAHSEHTARKKTAIGKAWEQLDLKPYAPEFLKKSPQGWTFETGAEGVKYRLSSRYVAFEDRGDHIYFKKRPLGTFLGAKLGQEEIKAAVILAAQKFDSPLRLTGNKDFKTAALMECVRLGIPVANPEMQVLQSNLIAKHKATLLAQKPTIKPPTPATKTNVKTSKPPSGTMPNQTPTTAQPQAAPEKAAPSDPLFVDTHTALAAKNYPLDKIQEQSLVDPAKANIGSGFSAFKGNVLAMDKTHFTIDRGYGQYTKIDKAFLGGEPVNIGDSVHMKPGSLAAPAVTAVNLTTQKAQARPTVSMRP